jgi:hypothetical protein
MFCSKLLPTFFLIKMLDMWCSVSRANKQEFLMVGGRTTMQKKIGLILLMALSVASTIGLRWTQRGFK